ncbi:hypothetical protein GCM10025864_23360 [Luteimicrobium album]|uniref:Uncharacterized protein n=1 Tax=Luteimicrobium album TaxID=1054550 RepID=A0ABQ6I270_9MICO|nr:hypothetical protein GCM10025864_23360 [Luteimicrobium album]
MLGGERPRVVPVRRRAAPVEEAGRRERERSCGDRGEPGAAPVGPDQGVDDAAWRVLAVREPVARDEDDVRPLERLQPRRHVVRQAVAAGHEPGRRPAHAHLVRHARARREDLRGDPDVERLRALEHEHGDTAEAVGGGVRVGAGVGGCGEDTAAR